MPNEQLIVTGVIAGLTVVVGLKLWSALCWCGRLVRGLLMASVRQDVARCFRAYRNKFSAVPAWYWTLRTCVPEPRGIWRLQGDD